jgi:hypothetical protein
MHQLEHELLELSIRIKLGRFDREELVSRLRALATQSHDYLPDPNLLWNEDGTRDYTGEEKRRSG